MRIVRARKERKKLTKDLVEKARPEGGKLTFFWDTDLTGFGLQITPKGAKSYVIKYVMDGCSRRQVIGRVGPEMPPEAARRKAQAAMTKVKVQGVDVARVAAAFRAEATMKEAFEEFITRHVAPKRKPRTAVEYRWMAKKHIMPAIGSVRVSAVTPAAVGKLHSSIGKDRTRLANGIIAVLSSFFNWYARPGHGTLTNGNPTKGIERFKENKCERFLSAEEFQRIGAALEKARDEGRYSYHALAAIVLLMTTGCRKEEVLQLQWTDVDVQRGFLRLPDSKTGKKVVVLSRIAAAVLDNTPRIKGNPFVFPGGVEGEPYRNLQKVWDHVRREAKVPPVRIHDLRHSYASLIADSGGSLPIIGKLLGHTQAVTTQRYAHLADSPVRAAADGAGDKLAGLLGAGTGAKNS